jgi:hypothetical protein
MYYKVISQLYVFTVGLLYSAGLLASASKLKSWGDNVVNGGQQIAISWIPAALVVCGFITGFGSRHAEGLLSKILMGTTFVFGAGAIGVLLKGIVS